MRIGFGCGAKAGVVSVNWRRGVFEDWSAEEWRLLARLVTLGPGRSPQ